jgi:hypothetical protein
MADLISKDIVDLQDIEKVQYIQALQADPAKYAAYVQQKSGTILGEVTDTKRAAFMKASGDMARMMDMNANSLAALYRTQDLLATEDHIISEQLKMKTAAEANEDMTRRQVEINNWYYENKRETLFVLQLVLLTLLTVTVLLYLSATGWVGEAGANYLMLIVILIGAGTWIYRWYYTSRIRDPRYWNRRLFPGDGKMEPASAQCPTPDQPALGPGGTPPILGPGGLPPTGGSQASLLGAGGLPPAGAGSQSS